MSKNTNTNDGGPAFPHPTECSDGRAIPHLGMTLRDWFAGQALAGIISRLGVLSYTPLRDAPPQHNDVADAGDEDAVDMNHYGTAFVAYEIADAMLEARGTK